MRELKEQLNEFGFSDKEAQVYLAMLEVGTACAQRIAEKADVNRATTYLMLESLKRRGLVSSMEENKKTLFTPESPERLLSVLHQEARALEEKKLRFEKLMPQFAALFSVTPHKPNVRFFEGEQGVMACREAMLKLTIGMRSARVFIHYDEQMLAWASRNEEQRLRLAHRFSEVRMLYTVEPGLTLPRLERAVQAKCIPLEKCLFSGELNIYDTFLFVVTAAPSPVSMIIESTEMTRLFRALFDLAWMAG